MEDNPMESAEAVVSNIQELPVVSEFASVANEEKKDSFIFKNRFLLCTSSHNRINRMGFFMNVLLLIIVAQIPLYINTSLVVIEIALALVFLFLQYMICIQILKRCHDFGSRGYMILSAVIIAKLFAISWLLVLFMAPVLVVIANIITNISLFILLLYLLLRPGNPEDNQYGKTFGL